MSDKSPASLKRLHEIHIARYTNRLARARAGNPSYREGELIALVKLWTEVATKEFVFEALSANAKGEVMDALMDEGD